MAKTFLVNQAEQVYPLQVQACTCFIQLLNFCFLFCGAEWLCLDEAGCPWNTKTVQHQRHCVLTLLKNTLWVTHSFKGFNTNNTGTSPAFTKLPRACDRNTAAISKSVSKQHSTQTLTAWCWKKPEKSILQQGILVGIVRCRHQQKGTRTLDSCHSHDKLCGEMPLSPLDYHSENSIYKRQQFEAFMASRQHPRSSEGTRLKKAIRKTAWRLLTHCTSNTAHNSPP